MQLHVLSLPHTQTTREFDHCAYTAKARKFASMMTDYGYEVVLYAGDENEARCAECVSIMPRDLQADLLSKEDWYQRGEIYSLPYDENLPIWSEYHAAAIMAIQRRIEPHDIICLTTSTHEPIMRAFPKHMCVETGVGYQGSCSLYRIFESYSWMHTVYGHQQTAAGANGYFYHAVIPNFFEEEDYPKGIGNGDGFLFMSRMTPRKGYQIAIDATKEIDATLVIAGTGGDHPPDEHLNYVGVVHGDEKARLLGEAKAVFVPTLYVEPFGGVAVEAMLTGTPVITTDFGAFTETVIDGTTGFRCHTMREFVNAAENADLLDRDVIREHAEQYSTENIAPLYDSYFERLQTLWGDGFYTLNH